MNVNLTHVIQELATSTLTYTSASAKKVTQALIAKQVSSSSRPIHSPVTPR